MKRYFKFFDYYLEVFAKRLSGRGLMNPSSNGEFNVLESIVKNSQTPISFIDGGCNIGRHVIKFIFLCKKYGVTKYSIFAVEPFPSNIKVLKKNLKEIKHFLIDKALGKEKARIKFFFEDEADISGRPSAINHYYLKNSIDVEQTTIDALLEDYDIKKIDFLKLDIEGCEYNALLGAEKTLSKGLIDYIQLEYNQTWIKGGGTIEKILELAQRYSYKLYRIRKNDMLQIISYDYKLDDFFYCNLILVREGCRLPLPSNRTAIPTIC